MKFLCTTLFLICTLTCSYGQHYHTVLPDTVVYFINDTGLIKAIRIDTSFTNGADNVYYNFNSVRVDTTICQYGLNSKGESWLGEKVVLKPDGSQIFLNKNKDSIVIKTLARTGESWKLFDLDNGNYLEGTVTTVSLENIFGVSDSIKMIALQARDSINNSVAHALNGKQIAIGKYSGFTTLLNFYEFPDDTINYQIHNKGTLTFRELYDFEVGDKIQRHTRSSSNYGYSNIYFLYHYLNKSFSGDSNTVYYTVERDSHFYRFDLHNSDSLISERHIRDTINVTYTNLNQTVIAEQPEELFDHFTLAGIYDLGVYSLNNSANPCGRVMRFRNYPYSVSSDSCIHEYIDGSEDHSLLIEGLGVLYESTYAMWGTVHQEFQFYQKNGCTYGQLFTGISSPSLNHNSISIYPNPATDEVTINLQTPIATTISLHDITGKEIFIAPNIQQFPFHLSINELSNGYYFISIHSQGGSLQKKLIIQK